MTVATPSAGAIFAARALLPDGWAADVRITHANGCITAVQPGQSPLPGDQRAAALIPGLPNLHSHAFQRAMAGLTELRGDGPDSFWTWRTSMYRFLDRLTPPDVQAIAAMAQVEMLEAGFTRVGEFHYLHHAPDGAPYADPAEMAAAIAAATAETGIALTLLPVFYAHSGFGGRAPVPAQRRFLSSLDSYARLHAASARAIAPLPDAVLGIAPHSLRAVTPEQLRGLLALAPEGPVHIHIAEQVQEVDDCLAWSGKRPVEWLLAQLPVDARWCLVHATHITPDELQALVATEAVAGLCPITEANLGDGLFPAGPFLAAGGRFGIGSDSNVRIDATEELRLLEYGQRLAHRGRNLLAAAPGRSTGADLLDGAIRGGAQALGARCSLAPGHALDAVSLDTTHPSLAARAPHALPDGLIFAAGQQAIDAVWRRGQQLVVGGRHIARPAIAARYRQTLAALLA